MSPSYFNATDTKSKRGEVIKNMSDPHFFCRKYKVTINSLWVIKIGKSGTIVSSYLHDGGHTH